jgi:hypothetical protein
MKRFTLSILVIIALLTAVLPFGTTSAQAACVVTPKVVTLYAGQSIDAGTVTVTNDASNLYVTFTATAPWLLSQTHVHVADSLAGIPQTKTGNPKIGNFAYQTTHVPATSTFTYSISKSALSLDVNQSVVIAAHAVVDQLDGSGNPIANETGWGDGFQFNPKGSWAMYFNYIWQDCVNEAVDSTTETAFAYGQENATCFDQFDTANRWGWTNGPLAEGSYTFDIYAAAGQCVLSKGTLVGTLDVNYSAGKATITYKMVGSNPVTGLQYTLTETHLYVGSEPLARNNQGEPTVAPGQFPYINPELNSTSRTYTISGLSGEIYVVAHATVAGFPK